MTESKIEGYLDPPKTRHFLAKTRQYVFLRGSWERDGFKWQEVFWDWESDSFRVWCGRADKITTEHCHFQTWAELPLQLFILDECVK